MGTAGVQTWELSTGLWEPLIMGAQQVYRPGNAAQGWWEPLIMGIAGAQTWELSTGVVGTPHNGHSRCTDLGTQYRDGGNAS
ncbi:unnamed protein product [Staurois parvus]|uniref:Uncharacterized protein n=1 Tax=Staurois parvus TaxID=386267 RepID=A0ABN9E8R5_9NEOB|nr:unnamed protein product [Staurois parvus]